MHLCQHVVVLFMWLCIGLLSGGVQGKPWRWHWGPASNSGPIGGPAWNGGPDESTDNIIIHSNKRDGKWRY